MKKLFILSLLFSSVHCVKSQTIDEAKTHFYYERYASAADVLRSVIAKGDPSPDAYYWLGEIFLKKGRLDSARKALMDGAGYVMSKGYSKKDAPLVYVGWSHFLLDSGNTNARADMESVLEETRYKNPEALLAAARANIEGKNGDVAWAIELLEKAIKRDRKNPEIYTVLGDAYSKQLDGGNAIKNYDEALEVNASFAEAMYRKGKIYKSQNNPAIYMDRFNKAYAIDSTYPPLLYELYSFYYFRDVVKAKKYLDKFISNSDPSPEKAYMKTDLMYVSKKYEGAIDGAKSIITAEADKAQPRLYKMIAYSYAALGDSVQALESMNRYFDKEDPSEFVAKDFELKAKLLEKTSVDKTASIEWYKKALAAQSDINEKLGYMKTLADLQKDLGNRDREAAWRGEIYKTTSNPSNLVIYKWGLALYSNQNYTKADSVFAIYQEKYPEQIYGYLWRARCNALIDSSMKLGLAVPHYVKLIEVASKDSVKNKSIIMKAYDYLGGYEATITKNFQASLGYFENLLVLDPENSDAQKNTELLRKWIEQGKGNGVTTNN